MSFAEEHAAGEHEAEIIEIVGAIEPHFAGHPRAVCAFALTRMLAVMLYPARADTREGFLAELAPMLHQILAAMDKAAK